MGGIYGCFLRILVSFLEGRLESPREEPTSSSYRPARCETRVGARATDPKIIRILRNSTTKGSQKARLDYLANFASKSNQNDGILAPFWSQNNQQIQYAYAYQKNANQRANQRVRDSGKSTETDRGRSLGTVAAAYQMIRAGLSVSLSLCLSVDLVLVATNHTVGFFEALFFVCVCEPEGMRTRAYANQRS